MGYIYRIKVELGAFPGAPGLNTWFVRQAVGSTLADTDVSAFMTDLRTFYDTIKVYMAPNVTMQILGDYDELQDADASLVSRNAVTAPAVVTAGAGSSATSRATMLKLQAITNTVSNNRLVRGGIFLGPVSNSAINGTDGSVASTPRTTVIGAMNALRTRSGEARWAIWRQPRPGLAGSAGPVASCNVFAKPAVLRSRRD